MSELGICRYKTIIFDCDGVILDSNKVKTSAFYAAALPWGRKAADDLVEYHVTNGGISRYKKFDHFLRHIIGKSVEEHELQILLDVYARGVRTGLQTCDVAMGLHELRAATPDARWLVVSGGDQSELRDIFAERALAHLFDGGIYGSPDTKDVILARETSNGSIESPAVFLGDSCYDYVSASKSGINFIFLSGWTEFKEWEVFFAHKEVDIVTELRFLLHMPSSSFANI